MVDFPLSMIYLSEEVMGFHRKPSIFVENSRFLIDSDRFPWDAIDF